MKVYKVKLTTYFMAPDNDKEMGFRTHDAVVRELANAQLEQIITEVKTAEDLDDPDDLHVACWDADDFETYVSKGQAHKSIIKNILEENMILELSGIENK